MRLGQDILRRVFRVPDHRAHFPIADHRAGSTVVPFLLPPAHDKLLGHDPIRDLWRNLHRTQDCYSSIVVIGYSMPQYDSYAYEALGRLLIEYQEGGESTTWEHRRVPIQIITKTDSESAVLDKLPFLRSETTRIWHHGFSLESMDWLDWGDGDPE